MLRLNNRFEKGDFVQQLSFKHEGLPRKDLGIEKFGFVQSLSIVARHYHEYNIVFAGLIENEESSSTLDYCLRPVPAEEVKEKLAYITNHAADFKHFILALNNCNKLSDYHMNEVDIFKTVQSSLTSDDIFVDSSFSLDLTDVLDK
ncbi:MAG TPA: hypothetical protein DCY20_01395 [Firmicutes bacterium]|nr:hypothetical protein [Bacillota bacterium]